MLLKANDFLGVWMVVLFFLNARLPVACSPSEERAGRLGLCLGLWCRVEDSANCFIKHLLESLLRQRRALEVLESVDLLRLCHSLLERDRPALVLLTEFIDSLLVLAKVELGSYKNYWNLCAVVRNLWVPFRSDVLN